MTRGDEHRIADILDAAQKLAQRLDIPFETWVGDEDLRLVTERLIEIIGEAARAMTDEGRANWPDVDWTGLIGLRKRSGPRLPPNSARVAVAGGHRRHPGDRGRAHPFIVMASAAAGSVPNEDVAAVTRYCANRIRRGTETKYAWNAPSGATA